VHCVSCICARLGRAYVHRFLSRSFRRGLGTTLARSLSLSLSPPPPLLPVALRLCSLSSPSLACSLSLSRPASALFLSLSLHLTLPLSISPCLHACRSPARSTSSSRPMSDVFRRLGWTVPSDEPLIRVRGKSSPFKDRTRHACGDVEPGPAGDALGPRSTSVWSVSFVLKAVLI